MFSATSLVDKLSEHNVSLYTGVPCSLLNPLISCISNREDVRYLPLNNEGEALAFACGAYLAGESVVVMIQNSGLGNMVNPLTSLSHPYRIPILMICTWRGQPDIKDEPQHDLMGRITPEIFSLLEVRNTLLPKDKDAAFKEIKLSFDYMNDHKLPYGLILSANTLEDCSLKLSQDHLIAKGTLDPDREMEIPVHTRFDMIKEIADIAEEITPIITTTGKSTRELYLYRDAANVFYSMGAMGCASSLALGVAMSLPHKKIIVIDGDGALLMRLEALASIGHYKPQNLIHILIDNNTYDSTGGQTTLSSGLALEEMAVTCGYSYGTNIISRGKLREELKRAIREEGSFFLRLRVRPGSISDLPRPNMSPYEIKERFMNHLQSLREDD